jgi:hypothetical protein
MQIHRPTDNSNWGHVSIIHKGEKEKFSFNIETNEIFNTDPVNVIRFKCAALTIATPLISVARVVYYLAKSIFVALQNFYYYLDGKNPVDQDTPSFFNTLLEIPRVLQLGAELTITAIQGILDPLEKRRMYGILERALNRHTDAPHRDGFYLAICCQPLAKLPAEGSDEELHKVEAKLIRYLNRIEEILAAVQSHVRLCRIH